MFNDDNDDYNSDIDNLDQQPTQEHDKVAFDYVSDKLSPMLMHVFFRQRSTNFQKETY
jgi:hypothetical protein